MAWWIHGQANAELTRDLSESMALGIDVELFSKDDFLICLAGMAPLKGPGNDGLTLDDVQMLLKEVLGYK